MQAKPAILPAAGRFPAATEMPFGSFNNRYAGGACHVVGRGRTEFDYADLSTVDEPIFFINDAVCLERHARSPTFFFAHDPQLLPWLDGRLWSTVVLPSDGKLFRSPTDGPFAHAGPIVFYRWRNRPVGEVLGMTRDQLAESRQLYMHTGTIHSLLHFVWFCGFHRVTLIGCDCLGDAASGGYDPRLQNLSRSAPDNYASIASAQRRLTALFGFETVYRGTPHGAESMLNSPVAGEAGL